jgi:hypothetical protein
MKNKKTSEVFKNSEVYKVVTPLTQGERHSRGMWQKMVHPSGDKRGRWEL